MRKISFIILLVTFITFGFGQEEAGEKRNGHWVITNQLGNGTLEAEGVFKINASVFEGLIGREFYLGNKLSLVTGIELLRVKGDFSLSGQQQFITNNYINLPISLKFYQDFSNNLSLFADVGPYAAYLYKSQIDIESSGMDNAENGLGSNFGLHVAFGLQYELSEKYFLSLGFKYKSDFADSYGDDTVFNLTDFYTVQFGLGFKL